MTRCLFALIVTAATLGCSAPTPTQDASKDISGDTSGGGGDRACCGLPSGPMSRAVLLATTQPTTAPTAQPPVQLPGEAPAGMVWVPPGEFTMGSDDPKVWFTERPAHRVSLTGFWMDQTEVTNAQFAQFIQDTGYITVAQRAMDWEEIKKQVPPGTPKPPDDMLVPGSVVFTPPDHAVPHEQRRLGLVELDPRCRLATPRRPGQFA